MYFLLASFSEIFHPLICLLGIDKLSEVKSDNLIVSNIDISLHHKGIIIKFRRQAVFMDIGTLNCQKGIFFYRM